MIHTGIDLIRISRISEALEKSPESFLNRICTQLEREELKISCQTPERLAQKVAGLFALKEAFSKALGTGIGAQLSFKDLEITHSTLGKPHIIYSGETFRYVSAEWKISCSLSHDNDMVVGLVVILGELK